MTALYAATYPERTVALVLYNPAARMMAARLLAAHHAAVGQELARFRGRLLDTAGDGVFATFEGPARAIRCACAIRESVWKLGLEVRAGLHTGECEPVGNKLGGIAVHIGARVASQAQPGQILVTSTVKDLVAGSGLTFDDLGPHQLKGVPGEWRLHQVTIPRPDGPPSPQSR
jgi:class 3 adenylate cyclase